MALERDPWSRVTYKGFAKSTAESQPAPAASGPRPRPRRRRRSGLAVAGLASLALLAAAVVAGLPTFARLWSGVPLQAALPSSLDELQAATQAPAPVQAAAPAPPPRFAPASKPITAAALAPPPLQAEPAAVTAPRHGLESNPHKARPRTERRRPGISAEARERALEATAAANLAATVAPDSTLSGQAASQGEAPFLSRPQ